MRGLDFDRRQYAVLVRLLRDLGARRELTSQLGLDLSATYLVGPTLLVMGGLCSLFALAHPPPRGFLVLFLGLTVFFLVPMLISEAADAFMNPAEAAVLAPRPIHGGAYFFAKLTYVLRAALVTALPLNAIPAIAGLALVGTRWFYPLTHLAAAAVTGVCTALLVCGGCGVLFRMLPIRRLRSAALWTQLVAMLVIPVTPQLLRFSGRSSGSLRLDGAMWSAVPLTWFTSLGLIGQATRPVVVWTYALPSAALCLALTVAGVTALSRNYMTRVVILVRARRARAGARRPFRRVVTRGVPGGPAARGAAAFVLQMVRRDWQFRRAFLQANAGLVVILAFSLIRAGLADPLGAHGLGGPVQLTPHVLGMVAVMTSGVVVFSDHYRAGWLFLTVPVDAYRGLARGLFWALWGACAGLPSATVLLLGVWTWGPQDGLLFAAYSLAVTSSYLGLGLRLVGGIPFTAAPRPSRATVAQHAVFGLLFAAAIATGIQAYVIMPSRTRTAVATVVLGLVAAAAARTSVQDLERRMRAFADRRDAVPRMFAASAEE